MENSKIGSQVIDVFLQRPKTPQMNLLICLQVQDDWQLGIHYSVNEVNHFELNEIVIIQRSDGRKTFAAICNIDSVKNEYECKVCCCMKRSLLMLLDDPSSGYLHKNEILRSAHRRSQRSAFKPSEFVQTLLHNFRSDRKRWRYPISRYSSVCRAGGG